MSLGFTTDAFLPAEPGAPASDEVKSAIPVRYAMKSVAGGQNVSIPYAWGLASTRTKSFALTLVDKHPRAGNWVHWMVIDIPASVTCLPEGVSSTARMPAGTREMKNGYGTLGYGGPKPPAGSGPHDYVATLYALDVASLELSPDATLAEFEAAVSRHTVGSETCTGWFAR
jgi:Raf kinase inhibitor-like YbhB/YbcL family protein